MNIKFISAVSFSLLSLFVLASCNNNSTDTTEPKEYTIKWKNYDGNILLVDEVLEGELPVYNGKEPFKEGNDQYSYTFSGWTPSVIKAYSDATYTATFNEVINTYQVVWKNYDGSVLEIDNNVPYNTLPTYDGETPLKPKSVEYSYSFDGWDKKILPVKENTEYVAKFKETINKYTITFETFDGSKVNSITADYGTLINEPEDKPILENYRFVGWCIDEDLTTAVTWPYKLVGDVTFYASYNEKVNIGQYLKSLLEGYSLGNVRADMHFRDKFQKIAMERGREFVWNELYKLNPQKAQTVHPNNLNRVIRYLELETNKQSENKQESKTKILDGYDVLCLAIIDNREEIYDKINKRVDRMIASGLENEVADLIKNGANREMHSMNSIGYKEWFDYFEGKQNLLDTINLIKQHSRNYCKRQMTFLKTIKGVDLCSKSEAEERIKEFMND